MSARSAGTTRHHRSAWGFTLVETIIAIGLLVLLMGGIYQFYVTTLRVRREGRAATRQALLARVILNEIAADIRQAAKQGFDAAIKGDRRSIEIMATSLPSREVYEIRSVTDGILPAEHDIRRRRYFLFYDEELTDENGDPIVYGMVRFEEKTLNSLSLRRGEDQDLDVKLYAPEIKYVEFRYSDGSSDRWLKKWDGALVNTIPQAIRITVGFIPAPEQFQELKDDSDIFTDEDDKDLLIAHPDRYSLEVRLPAASPPLGTVLTRGTGSLGGRS